MGCRYALAHDQFVIYIYMPEEDELLAGAPLLDDEEDDDDVPFVAGEDEEDDLDDEKKLDAHGFHAVDEDELPPVAGF
jgi:hypothetical protein